MTTLVLSNKSEDSIVFDNPICTGLTQLKSVFCGLFFIYQGIRISFRLLFSIVIKRKFQKRTSFFALHIK